MQNTAKMIPKTWKKCGAVYSNDREECVFVCVFCMEHAEHIYFVYSTRDASAFWKHIQQHQISADCEIIEEPPAKTRRTQLFKQHDVIMSHEINSNAVRNSDSNDSNTIGKAKNNIQLLDLFHESLIDNFTKADDVKNISETKKNTQLEVKTETEIQLQDLKIENEIQLKIVPADDNPLQLKIEDTAFNAHKLDNSNIEKTPSNDLCTNYTYDQGVYEISDDDDDEDDIFTNVIEPSDTNYRIHKDMIELSDDDDDEENESNTRPNSPQITAKNITNNKEQPAQEINSDSTNSGYRYHCLRCQITFQNRNKLIEHLETHEIEERINLNVVDSSNTMDPVNCIPTPEVSPNEENGHKNTNKQLQRYPCNYCPQRFFEVWQLDRHQRLHLSNRKGKRKFKSRPFQCNICGKRTTTEKAMLIHQRRFHSPESDIDTADCEICQKRVLTKNLHLHMLVHSELRYKCNHCNQTYKQKQTLRKHIRKCHPYASTYINPSAQLPPPYNQRELHTYTAMHETHSNTQSRQTEQLPLPLGSSQVSQPRLTPEEHDLMYSFFLHAHSLNQHKDQSSVSINAMDQTTS